MVLYLHSSVMSSRCSQRQHYLYLYFHLILETFLNQIYRHYINVYYMLIKGILMGLQVLGCIKVILQAVEKGIMNIFWKILYYYIVQFNAGALFLQLTC